MVAGELRWAGHGQESRHRRTSCCWLVVLLLAGCSSGVEIAPPEESDANLGVSDGSNDASLTEASPLTDEADAAAEEQATSIPEPSSDSGTDETDSVVFVIPDGEPFNPDPPETPTDGVDAPSNDPLDSGAPTDPALGTDEPGHADDAAALQPEADPDRSSCPACQPTREIIAVPSTATETACGTRVQIDPIAFDVTIDLYDKGGQFYVHLDALDESLHPQLHEVVVQEGDLPDWMELRIGQADRMTLLLGANLTRPSLVELNTAVVRIEDGCIVADVPLTVYLSE